MKCTKGKCRGRGIVGDHQTHDDQAANMRAAYGMRGSGSLQESVAKYAMWGAGYLAKRTFSKAYKCNKCGHVWRKWFDRD